MCIRDRRTTVLPQYEVQVTETPGLDAADRPAMKAMVASGLLDMQRLATLGVDELVAALNVLTNDYTAWIAEQRVRIGEDVVGYDTSAAQALDRCQEIPVSYTHLDVYKRQTRWSRRVIAPCIRPSPMAIG